MSEQTLSSKIQEQCATHMVMPTDLNPHGTLFGGVMMGWMDKVGVICAMELTGCHCVTVVADQIRFIRPVKLKEVVHLTGKVVEEGLTSVLVQVTAKKRGVTEKEGQSELVAESVFKFVALNEEEHPTATWKNRSTNPRRNSFERLGYLGRLAASI